MSPKDEGLRAKDSDLKHPGKVAHFFLRPSLNHLPGVSLSVSVAETKFPRHVSVPVLKIVPLELNASSHLDKKTCPSVDVSVGP